MGESSCDEVLIRARLQPVILPAEVFIHEVVKIWVKHWNPLEQEDRYIESNNYALCHSISLVVLVIFKL